MFPNNKEALHTAAEKYRVQLADLNSYAQKVLSSVPQESRVLVTAHDAFQYFGKRYGYEVVGIQGISTESEAGVKDIQRIVDLLVSRKIKAVFIESTVSERNIKALIEGAASRGHAVIIGGQLFSDAMGNAGTYEGTYLGMIDHNVTTIARALGGNAPVGGMIGKLTGVK
jgi:manganese/zinc/iron transport system substrate-binding protein